MVTGFVEAYIMCWHLKRQLVLCFISIYLVLSLYINDLWYFIFSLFFWLREAANCWGWGCGRLQTSVQKREVTIDFGFVVVVICDDV